MGGGDSGVNTMLRTESDALLILEHVEGSVFCGAVLCGFT